MTLSFKVQSRRADDYRHAHFPEPGDYWSDHLMPVLVVLEIAGPTVVFCQTINRSVPEELSWNLDVIHDWPLKEFTSFLEYSTIPGKFWATVSPRAHCEVVARALEIDFKPFNGETKTQ